MKLLFSLIYARARVTSEKPFLVIYLLVAKSRLLCVHGRLLTIPEFTTSPRIGLRNTKTYKFLKSFLQKGPGVRNVYFCCLRCFYAFFLSLFELFSANFFVVRSTEIFFLVAYWSKKAVGNLFLTFY